MYYTYNIPVSGLEGNCMMRKICCILVLFAIIVLNVSANAENIIGKDFEVHFKDGNWDYDVIMDGDKVKSVTVRNEDETVGSEAVFYIPNVSKGFVWSGDLKINQFYAEDKDGLGFIYGPFFKVGAAYDEATGKEVYVHLLLTRNYGIAVEQSGVEKIQDIYSFKGETEATSKFGPMSNGTKFHFEIIRDDNKLSMKINDVQILDMDLTNCDKPGDFDHFTEGYEFNLGMMGHYCSFTIENMTVVNLYEPEVTPTPEPTEEVKETPKPADNDEEKTPTKEKTKDKNATGVIISAVSAIAVLLIVVFVVIAKRRKK